MAQEIIDIQNEFSFLGKRYRLPSGKVQSVSINGQTKTPDSQGNVDLGNVQGKPGPQGPTGNVQVDGNGNVLIVNNLEEGGTGAALSAEMGKRLAMLSGAFAAAWAHSKVVPTTFCWLWVEENVDNSPVCKPIWHVGNSAFVDAAGAVVNVDAAAVPQAPAFTINGVTPTNNSEVNKNTELVITPDTDSVLYYKIGSGSYVASDKAVTIVLDTAGETYAFEAYCTNNKGDSTHATLTLSVAGTALATIEAKTGSTMTGTSPNFTVNRGGYVTLKADGDLTYTTDGSDPTSSGAAATVNGPNASVDIQVTGSMTIKAFNTDENDDDSTVSTWSLSIEALAKPSFSQADNYEFPAGGGQLAITAPTGYGTVKVYYNMTTDGTTPADPTNASTEYTGAITINADTKIKAIAYDGITASPSAVESASYTIAVAKITVKVNADTTMSLGDTGLTAIPLSAANNNGVNEFTIDKINTLAGTSYTSFADHEFASLSFGDNTKIVTFDGGGMKVKSLNSTFSFEFSANGASLTEVKGIVVAVDKDGNGNITGGGDIFKAFNEAQNLTYLEISGTVNGNMQYAFHRVGYRVSKCVIDISGLEGKPSVLTNAFDILTKTDELDISGIDTSAATQMNSVFAQGAFAKLVIGNFADSNAVDNNVFAYFAANKFTTLVCKSKTPPSLKASNSWLKQLADTQSSFTTIVVPDGCLGDASDSTKYAGADVWKDYSNKMVEESDYNNN